MTVYQDLYCLSFWSFILSSSLTLLLFLSGFCFIAVLNLLLNLAPFLFTVKPFGD